MATNNWTFTTPGNYTLSDAAKIEVADGVAKLLGPPSGLIVGGHFNSDINLDYRSDGQSLTGTAYNGAVYNTSEKKFGAGSISLPNNTSYVDYAGVVLSDYNVFTVSVWIKGSGNNRYLEFKSGASWNNAITIQVSSGTMTVKIWDSGGTAHNVAVFTFSETGWNHYELAGNGNTGANKFFLNGVLKGSGGGTFTRTAFILRAGQSWNKPIGESYFMDELMVFDSIQHTSNFTPPSAETQFVFPSDKPYIQPASNFNPGDVNSWDSFTETLGGGNQGSVGYILSDDAGSTWKYWNGSTWTTTTGDGTNTNTAAEVNTNIGSFPTTAGIMWRAFLISDASQQVEIDNITIEYTISIEGLPFLPGSFFMEKTVTKFLDGVIDGVYQGSKSIIGEFFMEKITGKYMSAEVELVYKKETKLEGDVDTVYMKSPFLNGTIVFRDKQLDKFLVGDIDLIFENGIKLQGSVNLEKTGLTFLSGTLFMEKVKSSVLLGDINLTKQKLSFLPVTFTLEKAFRKFLSVNLDVLWQKLSFLSGSFDVVYQKTGILGGRVTLVNFIPRPGKASVWQRMETSVKQTT